jgi:hypothetical protein
VDSYKNSCYKGFKTRDEADNDYSKFMLKEKSNHGVGKGEGQIMLSGLKNLIIFVQFIVIVVLLLSCARSVRRAEC